MEDEYVGGQATALLSTRECAVTAEQSQFFRLRCLDFYTDSVGRILKRIPFQESVWRHLKLLDPAVCMNGSAASIAPLAHAFPNLISGKAMQALDTEWQYLTNADIPASKGSLLHEFWGTVLTQKHCDGSTAFPALTEFVSAVLCLPHSNGAVERVFSAVNNMKTKLRNKLSTETICGLLHTKRLTTSSACHNFNIDRELMMRMHNLRKEQVMCT
ncbi:uncharacterized protein LOC125757409 [Rhipicephalus sanguineus]|uniref:uncharacterized protein LOC125757409 n=1 Tax=Rhipicephalus sanguineus TaxID=34632 RepID=UPI0020C3B0E9|nr:uncharacterized protein LOC125757409 [Rhipicephalus sanguineus]